MGGATKKFTVESAISCQECSGTGAETCVFPQVFLDERGLALQKLSHPAPELVGYQTMALCPECRRKYGSSCIPAVDFVRMRTVHGANQGGGVAPENQTLRILKSRFRI